MPSTATDRLSGLTTSVAVKAPCRLKTTANHGLSGLANVDGVTPAEGDRVLVGSQTDPTENGIYNASATAWTRTKDFDGTRDAVGGTQISVTSGEASAGTYWRVAGDGLVAIGTDEIEFEPGSVDTAAAITFTPAGAGALDRDVQSRLRETVSVLDYIPVALHASIAARTNATDLTAYVQAAFDYVDGLTTGGTLYFPPGDYMCEIDASNSDSTRFYEGTRLLGASDLSSRIVEPRADAVLLNMLGRNSMTVEYLHFRSGDRYASQCGIYVCRSTVSGNANNNKFAHLRIDGNFTKACAISIGAESSTWETIWFRNSNTDCYHRTFWTGIDPANMVVTQSAGTADDGPNTDNVMIDCEHHCPYDNAQPVWFSTSAGWTLPNCSVNCGSHSNCRLVTYTDLQVDGPGSIFTGPVTWDNPHFEVFGTGNSIHYLAGPGTAYYYSIHSLGGNFAITSATAALDFDRTVTTNHPLLQYSHWTSPHLPNGLTNVNIYAYSLVGCSIDWRPMDQGATASGSIILTGYAQKSALATPSLRCIQLVNCLYTLPDSAAPTTGTWPKDAEVRATGFTAGAPIGWRCSLSGTLGSLGTVTATTTSGSNVVTIGGANAANLVEGAYINIATATGGPWLVAKISGTTAYLSANVTNSVSGQAVSHRAGAFAALRGSPIEGSATYDPASLLDGAGATTTITATGAALGDFATASFSLDLQGITLTAWVSAADTVSVRFQNESGGTLDLASGTLRVRVEKL